MYASTYIHTYTDLAEDDVILTKLNPLTKPIHMSTYTYIHTYTDLAEDDVLSVEPGGGDGCDEKLPGDFKKKKSMKKLQAIHETNSSSS